MRALLLAPLLLTGCAGTTLTLDGEVCGAPVKLSMVDRKDRTAFALNVECPEGGSVAIDTSESSTSQVLEKQIDLTAKIIDVIPALGAAAREAARAAAGAP